AQGGHPHDRHHADAGAEQGEHRTGAGPDQRPAETEQDASGHVADARAQHLWGNDDRLARQGAGPALEEREPRGRHGERGGEYFVEVRALEAQCLLDAEPGRQLPLGQHDPEQDAHAEVGAEQALPVLRGRGSHGRGGGHRGTSSGSRKPPATTPATKTRFHRPRERQSYLKNSTLPGKVAAQMWRRLAETPNGLLPIASNATATRPTSGPVTYQGHGLSRNETIGLLQDRHERPRRTTAGRRYGFRGRNSRSW